MSDIDSDSDMDFIMNEGNDDESAVEININELSESKNDDSLLSFKLTCFSYMCSSKSDVADRLKYSNKILLPESVLYKIKDNEDLNFPLFFKVSNTQTLFGCVCGIEEFSSPPGVCHLPYQIMSEISVSEGDKVDLELVCPPKGDFVKFRFHSSEFSRLGDTKKRLENIISSDYPVLTQGQTIVLNCKDLDKIYHIDVVETKPTEVIQIINTNLNVDFDRALDCKDDVKEDVEPPCPFTSVGLPGFPEDNYIIEESGAVRWNDLSMFRKWTNGFVPFSGRGYRLGSK